MVKRAEPASRDLPAELSDIAIDRSADVPVGVQLTWSLRSRIEAGRLRAEQRLPGVRELAEAVGLNVNTVRAVYQRLDQEGLIDTQQGSGSFVAGGGGDSRSTVAEIAAGAADAAVERGVSPRHVAEALYVSVGRPEDRETRRRERLRGEIRTLDAVLAGLEADHPDALPPAPRRRQRGPALLSAAELENVRAQLLARLAAIQGKLDAAAETTPPEPERSNSASSPRAARVKDPQARRGTTQRPATAGA